MKMQKHQVQQDAATDDADDYGVGEDDVDDDEDDYDVGEDNADDDEDDHGDDDGVAMNCKL